jgi:hypothetical protein
MSWLLLAGITAIIPTVSSALPSYARQMDMQCTACHTEFPILTDMGRQFKLSGYTMSANDTNLPPIAFMIQPSFTQTAAGQQGGAAPGFADNNNYATSQFSIFYAGRLFGPYASKVFGADSAAATFLNKFGIFNQTTYDGVGKAWSWDNTDLRYADMGTLGGHSASYGVYINNNPTLQDPWNSTPAFGYPFSGSKLAPTPAAGAMIDGGLAGQVAGVGAYSMLDSRYYVDVGAYRTLSTRFQNTVGVDPTGETQISGVAPYWRFAVTTPVDSGSWEVGTFGMAANTFPGRDPSAGSDRTTDVGVDSQYQRSSGPNDITAFVTAIYERNSWNASQQLGNTSNTGDTLKEFRASVDYLYDKTYGGAVQFFTVSGSNDPLEFGTSQTGAPNSNGFILQANYMPFNKAGGPAFWPKSNVKFSAQYVIYNRFDGSVSNVDGAGRSARDNNTLYFEAWIMF